MRFLQLVGLPLLASAHFSIKKPLHDVKHEAKHEAEHVAHGTKELAEKGYNEVKEWAEPCQGGHQAAAPAAPPAPVEIQEPATPATSFAEDVTEEDLEGSEEPLSATATQSEQDEALSGDVEVAIELNPEASTAVMLQEEEGNHRRLMAISKATTDAHLTDYVEYDYRGAAASETTVSEITTDTAPVEAMQVALPSRFRLPSASSSASPVSSSGAPLSSFGAAARRSALSGFFGGSSDSSSESIRILPFPPRALALFLERSACLHLQVLNFLSAMETLSGPSPGEEFFLERDFFRRSGSTVSATAVTASGKPLSGAGSAILSIGGTYLTATTTGIASFMGSDEEAETNDFATAAAATTEIVSLARFLPPPPPPLAPAARPAGYADERGGGSGSSIGGSGGGVLCHCGSWTIFADAADRGDVCTTLCESYERRRAPMLGSDALPVDPAAGPAQEDGIALDIDVAALAAVVTAAAAAAATAILVFLVLAHRRRLSGGRGGGGGMCPAAAGDDELVENGARFETLSDPLIPPVTGTMGDGGNDSSSGGSSGGSGGLRTAFAV